jgi:hypothetical protein
MDLPLGLSRSMSQHSVIVRAFFDIKRKDKVIAHTGRRFPGLKVQVVGKYWKDESLWEATAQQEYEYCDDKAALWETLTYFSRVSAQWTILSGPNGPEFQTLIEAVAENNDGTGLTWCHFELCRGSVGSKDGI